MPTLADILDAKESRWQLRLELCRRGRSLLTLTMNVPGPDKNLPRWNEAHGRYALEIEGALKNHVLYMRERKTPAGAESHFVTDLTAHELKRYAVSLEEGNPVGRLLDADVMDNKGNSVDRKSLCLPSRRCLCCSGEAKVCSREKRHSLEEILSRAEEMLELYSSVNPSGF
ncbi:citrate lyase holo-ACP synthase [Synergistales bacterium]|nr:citrate lyase holo-ACP synthase [Synergistales bacterium]